MSTEAPWNCMSPLRTEENNEPDQATSRDLVIPSRASNPFAPNAISFDQVEVVLVWVDELLGVAVQAPEVVAVHAGAAVAARVVQDEEEGGGGGEPLRGRGRCAQRQQAPRGRRQRRMGGGHRKGT